MASIKQVEVVKQLKEYLTYDIDCGFNIVKANDRESAQNPFYGNVLDTTDQIDEQIMQRIRFLISDESFATETQKRTIKADLELMFEWFNRQKCHVMSQKTHKAIDRIKAWLQSPYCPLLEADELQEV